jgi:Ca2+-binding EF-hand superfamily protein
VAKALGLADDTDIDSAYAGFDTNQDGTLSMEEFVNLYHQYWSAFDASVAGHRWIGP